LAERLKLKLDYDELTNCMRCGFCQPSCPTFKETGLEAASPRGRIALMKASVDGVMTPDDAFAAQIDLCLGCRACEPVCPADVKYGHLLEQAREAIEDVREHRLIPRTMRRLFFRGLFPHRSRLRFLGGLLRTYQATGLNRLARKLGIMRLFPETTRQMETILPEASASGVVERLGEFVPAQGQAIATVGMFRGCIMDVLFAETNVNTVKLLTEAGFNVVIPKQQSCCGALHAHAGDGEQARELARNNIDVFRAAGVDYIASNAGGCGALLVDYDHLLREDEKYAADAEHFAGKVKDIGQLLMEKGRIPRFSQGDEPPMRVTYQDSCHLRNGMRAANAPRDLLDRVEGVDFVEMRGADTCCGSAGIYNLMQPRMSTQILDHKMEHTKETQAQVVLTSNPGCLLQMKLGIERAGSGERMQAEHIVDFLAARIRNSDG
jgi:glycolate oxidase iron-sulfur subunit